MTRYRIERISGSGLPERYQGKLFDTVEEAVKVATEHHEGKFQIVHVEPPDALGPELEGPLLVTPRAEPEPPPAPPEPPPPELEEPEHDHGKRKRGR